ncbi:hypothetical protein [Rhizobium ruizarguesonis]|uniref:hypothetical protein n=1 Tax=Rhizobium ruizarguesonis TaxID=2081791 RepID=UPI001032675C|nr:hypothetical protein [Rhizobium ruizarguesonis]TBE87707.1 hypothetical protein ELG99_13055 [Rhizobium ruizarguesonis]
MREALQRASLWNGFPRPSVIIDLAGCTSVRRLSALATCDNRSDIAELAQVLNLDPDAQDRLLREKLPVHASRDFVMFFGHAVRRGYISNARRIAPETLAQGEGLKAIWSLKPLALDPVSREYLCDRCPCGALLGWELSCHAWTCDQCGADLRGAPVKIYEPRDEKALDFAARLIDPEACNRKISLPAGSELADERAGDLFQLVVRIAETCQRVGLADRRATIEPQNLERAGRSVLDWPHGFVELVENVTAPTSESRELGWFDSKPLRRLQFDQTMPATIRTRIKGLLDSARRIEAVKSKAFTPSSSAYPSKVGDSNRLKRPREAVLSLIRSRGTKVDDRLAASAHFNPYMTALRDIHTVRRFSEELGVPMPAVWELLTCGLAPELATAIAHLGSVSVPTIEGSLIANLSKAIRPGTANGALGLVSCCFALDPSLALSWSSILRAVLDGRLEVWRGKRPNRGLMSELVVTDFSFLRSLVAEQATNEDVRNAPMSHNEVSMTIDRTRSVAANIVNSGLISGVSTVGKLAELRKSWAFSFELQTLSEMTRQTIKNLHRTLKNVDVKCMTSGNVTFWQRDEALSRLGLRLS